MIRILLMSDSHGFEDNVRWALEKHPDIARVYHLGDGAAEQAILRADGRAAMCVAGNCDWWSDMPKTRLAKVDGLTLLLTHGHEYGVKQRLDTMAYAAEAAGATVALFGHTHRQKDVDMGGVRLVNPGSIRAGEYAILSVQDGKIDVELRNLND